MDIIRFVQENRALIIELLIQHLRISGTAVLCATVLAIPIGVVATRRKRIGFVSLNIASFGQSIPTFGVLGLMIFIPGLGIGFRPAFIAMVLIAFLPILRNTCVGISTITSAILDAGRGMGMSPRQILFMIELPLAVPVILAGIRTATVMVVSTAALAAYIGAGGLGRLIVRGLEMNDNTTLLVGGAAIAALALAADRLIGLIERVLSPARLREEETHVS
jgi:osmoprotectant transport system permease protein